jgi:plastocyanin
MRKLWMVSVVLALVAGLIAIGAPRTASADTAATIVNFSFQPNPITVTVGTTVTWTNQDSAAHTATSDTGDFDTGLLQTGKSGSVTFKQAGTFPYHCQVHPNMKGTVIVQQASGSTPSTSATSTTQTTNTPPPSTPTATAPTVPTPTATPVPVPAVTAIGELMASPPGVTGRFTVTFSSLKAGQGEVYFGPSFNALVMVATRDRHAGTTQHAVIVTGNDLPGPAGDVGILPGATYFFQTVTITPTGQIVDNNGGKCYSVTIPAAAPTASTGVLTATMLGSNEPGAGAPTGRGFATVTVNTSTNTVCWTLNVSGITLPALASHIHRGGPTTAGPVVVPFTAPGANGTATGCTSVDAALAVDILANPSNYYVNVHTTEFPGGAIRGQLGTSRVLVATMLGTNEQPAGALTGKGAATVTIDTSSNTLCWTLSVSGITLPALASHIHKGGATVVGPVVVPFTAPGADGTARGCTTVDAALLRDIAANPSNYYVNVHTTEFPAGAIRGQLRIG